MPKPPPPRKTKVIRIVGSRRRSAIEDLVLCRKAVDEVYEKGDQFVSGGCPLGADDFAEGIAKDRGATITIHFPDWGLGRWAGFARNTKIAEECDVLIALVHQDRTGGTEDTVKKALKLGKRVIYA